MSSPPYQFIRYHRLRKRLLKHSRPSSPIETWIIGVGAGVVLGLVGIFLLPVVVQTISATSVSNAAIREDIMRQSLASYSGPCPCPFSVLRSGRRCDYNAYDEPGGYEPVCYTSDVNWFMLLNYRLAHPSN